MPCRVQWRPMARTDPALAGETSTDSWCPHCGYDLRGIDTGRCPECGGIIDAAARKPSQIPWRHRNRNGAVRSYIRTVLWVIFHPGRFRNELDVASNYRDARQFWMITVAIAYAPVLFTTALLYGKLPAGMSTAQVIADNQYGLNYAAVALNLGALFFLLAATALPSCFCVRRGMTIVQQNRAIALSYYGCAVLALSPLLLLCTRAAVVGDRFEWGMPFWILTGVVALAMGITWLINTLRILFIATDRKRAGRVRLGMLLPLMWVLLAILLGVVFPFLLYSMLMLLGTR
jgi:hypothetical protein